MERCASKITDFDNRTDIEAAKDAVAQPAAKISLNVISDKQGVKSRSAYHHHQSSAGSGSLRSSIVIHPNQDKDIAPLGGRLYEPHQGIKKAH